MSTPDAPIKRIDSGRDAKGRWAVGNKPVSPGRPMLPPELKAMCQGAAPEAIAVAIKLYKDEQQPAGARIKACEVILDRAYGKAPQSVDVTTGGEQIQQVTIVEIVSPALPLRQTALPEPE